jgi:hypothetical protein
MYIYKKNMQDLNITLKLETFNSICLLSQIKRQSVSDTIENLLDKYILNEIDKNQTFVIDLDTNLEIWKDILGYEGIYQVSNYGRIASLRYGFKIRSLCKNPAGYSQVSLIVNNVKKLYLVHILVANTFLEKPIDCTQVDHINNIKKDNRVSNLQWITRSNNIKNNFLRNIDLVKNYNNGKKVELFSASGESLGVFNKVGDAAKFLNVVDSTICYMCSEKENSQRTKHKNKITAKYI